MTYKYGVKVSNGIRLISLRLLSSSEELAAAAVARKIFMYCRERDKDIDGCVSCRLAGLQYMTDLAGHLEEGHPLKHEEKIDEITEFVKRQAMLRLKG